jgi:hypothetical protein
MSHKKKYFITRIFCGCFVFSVITLLTCALLGQVPTNTPGKDIKIAYANETANSAGTIESLHLIKSKNVKVEKIVANSPVPFGPVSNILLDMKGYDPQFTRSFTFKNTSSTTYTINSIGFDEKNTKFDFVSIAPDVSFPVNVAPGETFTVRISFISSDRNKACTDRLIFTTEENKEPIVYPIRAIQQPLSDMPWNKKAIASSVK